MNKVIISSIVFLLSALSYANAQTTDGLEKAIELSKQGNWHECRTVLEEIVAAGENNAEVFYYLGRSFLVLGDHDKAIKNIKKAVELTDGIADYHFWLGQAYGAKLMKSGSVKRLFLGPKMKGQFQKAVEIDPGHVQALTQLASYYVQAPSIAGGSTAKAHEQARRLIELDEKQGRVILARIYEKKSMPDSARYQYEQLENKYGNLPDFYSFYNDFGYLLLGQKRYEAAISKFKKQVELAPDKANPRDSLGDCLRAAGKLQDALIEYQKALEIDPNLKVSAKKLKAVQKEIDALANK